MTQDAKMQDFMMALATVVSIYFIYNYYFDGGREKYLR